MCWNLPFRRTVGGKAVKNKVRPRERDRVLEVHITDYCVDVTERDGDTLSFEDSLGFQDCWNWILDLFYPVHKLNRTGSDAYYS
jgi:hypothetical protein